MEVDSCGRGGDEPRFTGPTRDGEAACPPHIGPLCLHSKTDALCACNCFMWIDPLQHPEFFPLCCGSARCISSPTLVMSVLAHHSCAAEEAGCCSSVCLRDLIFPRSSLFRCRWSLACCLTTPIACQATTRCSHRFRCICCVHGHFPRDRARQRQRCSRSRSHRTGGAAGRTRRIRINAASASIRFDCARWSCSYRAHTRSTRASACNRGSIVRLCVPRAALMFVRIAPLRPRRNRSGIRTPCERR